MQETHLSCRACCIASSLQINDAGAASRCDFADLSANARRARENPAFPEFASQILATHSARETNDWVVLHCDDGPREHQWTINTAGFGPLRGRRIVRGREDECSALFSMTSEKAAASEQPESAIDPIVQTTGRHG